MTQLRNMPLGRGQSQASTTHSLVTLVELLVNKFLSPSNIEGGRSGACHSLCSGCSSQAKPALGPTRKRLGGHQVPPLPSGQRSPPGIPLTSQALHQVGIPDPTLRCGKGGSGRLSDSPRVTKPGSQPGVWLQSRRLATPRIPDGVHTAGPTPRADGWPGSGSRPLSPCPSTREVAPARLRTPAPAPPRPARAPRPGPHHRAALAAALGLRGRCAPRAPPRPEEANGAWGGAARAGLGPGQIESGWGLRPDRNRVVGRLLPGHRAQLLRTPQPSEWGPPVPCVKWAQGSAPVLFWGCTGARR